MTTGDFNGDGWPDVAVSNGSSLEIFYNQPSSAGATAAGLSSSTNTFTLPRTAGVAATGNFNHDGLADVAVADSTGKIDLFTGAFNSEGTYGSSYYGQSPVLLTSTTSVTNENFDAVYIPTSSDLYATATSSVTSLQVFGSSTPVLTFPASTPYGQNITFSVTVPPIAGTYPTGTVLAG